MNTSREKTLKRKPLDPDPEMWAALDNGVALTTILLDFYSRVFQDERLSGFFTDVTQEWVAGKQWNFLAQILTGENIYFGQRPRNAHHQMVISDELFDYREELLMSCFRRHGVAEHLIERVRIIDEVFRKQIVKSTPRLKKFNGTALPNRGYGKLTLDDGGMCDGCSIFFEKDAQASYHLRTGKVYCDKCMEDRDESDIE